MSKLNKFLAVCFALLMIAIMPVAGTWAYEVWNAEQYADETTEKIEVRLLQQQRAYDTDGNLSGLEPFADEKQLVPLVGSAQYDGSNFDRYGMPVAAGYVDQIVRVKNEGTAAAYVRVIAAIPAALDDVDFAGNNALHWNLGNRFMPNGDFSAENTSNPAFEGISWKFSEKAVVEGVLSNLYIFTYEKELAAGAVTGAAAFVGFYLDQAVDIVNGHIMLNGEDTEFSDEKVKIPVAAQAVQSYGFSSAQEAFDEAGTADNPWKS